MTAVTTPATTSPPGATSAPAEIGPADPADLASYPFTHPVAARFGDVDSVGHLNNVAIAAFYEEARVAFVRHALGGGTATTGLTKDGTHDVLLAEQTIRYLAEAEYPGTYQVGLGVGRLGTSSVVLLAGLFTEGRCVGTSRHVLVHMAGDRPAPVEGALRVALEQLAFGAAAAGDADPPVADPPGADPSGVDASDADPPGVDASDADPPGVDASDADPPGVDLGRLTAYLQEARPELVSGPLHARLISGGRSNLTYLLDDGASRWVLRRPPLGHVLASAHDMAREYRVLSALAGTPVPVPPVEAICEEAAVIGAPFYLMAHVPGTVLRDAEQLAALSEPQARVLMAALVDTLADLHAVDPAAVGLADLGRPEGFLERQVRTWGRQLASSRSRDLPELEELGRRLAVAPPPTTRPAIVHGDYRLDNVLTDLGGDVPRIVAVLDWEMATLGDALADLAMMLIWYDGLAGLDSPVAVVPRETPGFPPASALLARYVERTGADLTHLPWHLGLAHYKIGAIFEGIHYRHLAGQTVGEGFDRLGVLVRPVAERGLAALAGRATL